MELPYRKNVCLLIINHKKQLFMGERAGQPGIWQFPQGGVEEGESLEANALREAAEELGAPESCFVVKATLEAIHQYDFSKPPPYAQNHYRGQRQNFLLLEFIGNDSAITLVDLQGHREMQNFAWIPAKDVLAKAEALRRPGYEKALTELANKKLLD